jgi:hypothetical protein
MQGVFPTPDAAHQLTEDLPFRRRYRWVEIPHTPSSEWNVSLMCRLRIKESTEGEEGEPTSLF